MNDVILQFLDAIRAAGLEPPDVIDTGKIHRFPGVGKPKGNTAGWCMLFDDGLGGCFGDWSTGDYDSWHAKQDRPLIWGKSREVLTVDANDLFSKR